MKEESRQLICDLLSWRPDDTGSGREIRNLREKVVLLTGRADLAKIDSLDDDLRPRLLDAIEDYLD